MLKSLEFGRARKHARYTEPFLPFQIEAVMPRKSTPWGSPAASTRGEVFHAVSEAAGSAWRLTVWLRCPWAALVAGKGLADFLSPGRNCQAAVPFGSAFLQPGEQDKCGCNSMTAQPCARPTSTCNCPPDKSCQPLPAPQGAPGSACNVPR